MPMPDHIDGFHAQDVRISAEPDGSFVIVGQQPSGQEFGISLNDHLAIKAVWLMLRRAYDATRAQEPIKQLPRGLVDTPDALPVSEIRFQLSHDHTRVVVVLRFGALFVPISMDPAILIRMRAGIAEVEAAVQAAPGAPQ